MHYIFIYLSRSKLR